MRDPKESLENYAPQKLTFLVKDQLEIVGDAYGKPDNPPVLLAHGGGTNSACLGEYGMIFFTFFFSTLTDNHTIDHRPKRTAS